MPTMPNAAPRRQAEKNPATTRASCRASQFSDVRSTHRCPHRQSARRGARGRGRRTRAHGSRRAWRRLTTPGRRRVRGTGRGASAGWTQRWRAHRPRSDSAATEANARGPAQGRRRRARAGYALQKSPFAGRPAQGGYQWIELLLLYSAWSFSWTSPWPGPRILCVPLLASAVFLVTQLSIASWAVV